jgi:hypothetical protein
VAIIKKFNQALQNLDVFQKHQLVTDHSLEQEVDLEDLSSAGKDPEEIVR